MKVFNISSGALAPIGHVTQLARSVASASESSYADEAGVWFMLDDWPADWCPIEADRPFFLDDEMGRPAVAICAICSRVL